MGKQARNQSRALRQARAAALERAKKRNRLLAAGGGLVILGLVVAIGVSLVNAAGRSDVADSGKPIVAPAGATAQGALAIGKASAPVRVEVFLDYMCPFCGRFERANGADVDRLVAEGKVRLELYPLSFLDRTSAGTRYSTRAANAVATVADRAPDRLLAFHAALFANQPEEGSRGLSDDEIGNLARGAGVPENVVVTFSEGTFEPWIVKFTEAAFSNGISGTPTVKINGSVFQGDLYAPGVLTRAVAAATGR